MVSGYKQATPTGFGGLCTKKTHPGPSKLWVMTIAEALGKYQVSRLDSRLLKTR